MDEIPAHRCEPDWCGETVAILGRGPSLEAEDLGLLADCRVIALNGSYRFRPEADVLLLADHRWIAAHPDLSAYRGPLIVVTEPEALGAVTRIDPRMRRMRAVHPAADGGMSRDRGRLTGRRTSVSHALSYAELKGAARALLLGVDLQPGPDGRRRAGEPGPDPGNHLRRYGRMAGVLAAMAPHLERHGLEVVNCSPRSTLQCFRKAGLAEALS